MKKFLAIPVLLVFCCLLTSFVPVHDPVTTKKESRCGPGLRFYNSSGNVVTRITIQSATGTSFTINNPAFPYLFPEALPQGNTTFNIRFATGATNSGSISVIQTPDAIRVACETYEPPYASPVAFNGSCYVYNILIDANPATCD